LYGRGFTPLSSRAARPVPRRERPRGRAVVVGQGGRVQAQAPGCVAVRAARGQASVPIAVRALDDAGIGVESLEVVSPTLDDVFAAVTGSTLEGAAQSRDGDAEPEVVA
jgi:ABC-2 type transport system ATP-binding protein